jgi:ketosteroid isomerase-like protein
MADARGPNSTSNWDREIRDLEEQARTAFLAANVETLDRLWADGLLVNSPLQQVNERGGVLALLRSGRIRHSSLEVEIEHISRHGDVVVVMGNDTVTDPPDGAISRRRFSNIWQLQDGQWRMIARHAHVVMRETPAGGTPA